MTLDEAVIRLSMLDDNAILCVRQPWTPSSECAVAVPDENLGVPRRVKDAGLAYFLEVHVARQVLDVFGDKPPTDEEKVRLLIHYAENDAYPEWVYQR